MRKEKGITLVALIITIVVLLILAVVAISSIQEQELIGKANSATTKWNQSQNDEEEMLNSYESILNEYGSNNQGGSGNASEDKNEGASEGESETVCTHNWVQSNYNGPSVCTTCGLECAHPSEMREYFNEKWATASSCCWFR